MTTLLGDSASWSHLLFFFFLFSPRIPRVFSIVPGNGSFLCEGFSFCYSCLFYFLLLSRRRIVQSYFGRTATSPLSSREIFASTAKQKCLSNVRTIILDYRYASRSSKNSARKIGNNENRVPLPSPPYRRWRTAEGHAWAWSAHATREELRVVYVQMSMTSKNRTVRALESAVHDLLEIPIRSSRFWRKDPRGGGGCTLRNLRIEILKDGVPSVVEIRARRQSF